MSEPLETRESLIDFIQGVSDQDLWNGRAREKFSAVLRVLKSAPASQAQKELEAIHEAVKNIHDIVLEPSDTYTVRLVKDFLLAYLKATAPASREAAPAIGVDAMVNRFLGWSLPKTFSPDCGISFDGRKPDQWNPNGKGWPVGTNLLNADEAKEMLEYLLAGAPST
jgi:hypothetical protein